MNTEEKKECFVDGDAISEIVKKVRQGKVETIRAEGADADFQLLCEICFEPMMSREQWKLNHSKIAISTLLTVSDEAFALLTLENNVEEWMELAVKGQDAVKKGDKTKYTSVGMNKDGTKKGWSLEGKKRFNEIYDAVVTERASQRSKAREAWLITEWSKTHNDNSRRRKTGNTEEENAAELERIREEESFTPRNGFIN